ncbi:MAG: hypothetical protein GPJ51_10075 [Candidatus Heimdallarchaeota archaeon]|nr:hypothetical protein [Candidatus Heimdallarchaeota archaeon]
MKLNKKIRKIGLPVLLIFLIVTIMISKDMIASIESSKVQNINTESSYTETMWLTTEVISTESNGLSGRSSIAVDSNGNVHVAWYDYTNYTNCGIDTDIFYKFWNATSKSWNSTEVVSTESTFDSQLPSIAVDGNGNVHVAWFDMPDYDIFYKSWNATSMSWSSTEVLATESTSVSAYVSLAVDDNGNVHAAWVDWTNYAGSGTDADIFYKFWNATSMSWNSTEVVSTESTLASNEPTLVVTTLGDVHIAWKDNTNYAFCGSDSDIFYKFWNATSRIWTITEVVSTYSNAYSDTPSIDVDSLGNVHIAWKDIIDIYGGPDQDIFHRQKSAITSSWATTEVVSSESSDSSSNPALVVDNVDNIHVVWHDYTNYLVTDSDWDIFYKFWNSTDSTWNTTELVSTVSTDGAAFPDVTWSDEGNIHIVWHDWTNYTNSGDDIDIFYRKLLRLPYPILDDISPSVSTTGNITLNWNAVSNTEKYYIYRSLIPIVSFASLTPLATLTSSTTYEDLFLTPGIYYYIVVASNEYLNRSSNEEWVIVELPPVIPELPIQSLFIMIGLITLVPSYITFKMKRRNN